MSRRISEPKTNISISGDNLHPFSLELAQRYLALDAFEYERAICSTAVESLRAMMAAGKFDSGQGSIAIAYCTWDKKHRRLNGQHRCMARLLLNNDSFAPKIRVVRYRAETEDEYRYLYMLRDNGGTNKIRTIGQLAGIGLGGTEEFRGTKQNTLIRIERGYRVWKYGFANNSRVPIDDTTAELRGAANSVATKVAKLIQHIETKKDECRHFRNAPVYAAMFETMKHPIIAARFWKHVLEQLFQTKTDPGKVLSDYLRRSARGNRKCVERAQIVTATEMFNVCIRCFETYREGRQLKRTPAAVGPRLVVV